MTTRARITETDAIYLAFLSKFPAADPEALSYIVTRRPNPFGATPGELPDLSGVTKRLRKLEKIGAVTRFRNPISGVQHYGVTALGHEGAIHYGHHVPVWRSTDGLSLSRLEHYRNIALVGGQLTSPTNHYRDTLGIDAVPLDQLISENELRAPYDTARAIIKNRRAQGEATSDYATYRRETFASATQQVENGQLTYAAICATYPHLLTIGTTGRADAKPIHQADLAIRLDDTRRDNATGRNWLVEIELSAKTGEQYEQILRTFYEEFAKDKIAYERAIYFVGSKSIENTLRYIDTSCGTRLIDRKRLTILPIEGRTKHPARQGKRIVAPPTPAPTVPNLAQQLSTRTTDDDGLPDLLAGR